MSGSRNKQKHQTKLPVDAPPAKKRGGLQRLTGSHLPVPYSAVLSPAGLLSFSWQSPMDRTAKGSFRSTNQLSRKVVGTLWRKFLAISDSSDENIRKFAERWGSLRVGSEETVMEWRRFAVLGNALVSAATAIRRDQLARED